MKFNHPISVLLASILVGSARAVDTPDFVTPGTPVANLLECVESYDPNADIDYFPDKINIEYSEHWSISYHKTYKIITNRYADGYASDSDTSEDWSILLYQCGTPPPADQLDGQHNAVISVPLQDDGVVLTSTVQISHLELLGKRNAINAYRGDASPVSSPCLKDMIADGTTTVFNTWIDDDNKEWTDNWIKSYPNAVVVIGPWSLKGTNTVITSEAMEKTNEAIFEWHKFYGALFNLEAQATETFETSDDRFKCHATNAATTVQGDFNGEKPKVLWAYYSPYYGAWDVGHCPNYYCDYAKECSATLLDADYDQGSVKGYNGRMHMNDEEFFMHAKDAAVWVYPSNEWDTTYKLKKDALDQLESVKNKKVYDYQLGSTDAWFEQRVVELGKFSL
jgi:iron complex transport system substrate-binding protein